MAPADGRLSLDVHDQQCEIVFRSAARRFAGPRREMRQQRIRKAVGGKLRAVGNKSLQALLSEEVFRAIRRLQNAVRV